MEKYEIQNNNELELLESERDFIRQREWDKRWLGYKQQMPIEPRDEILRDIEIYKQGKLEF